MFNLKIQECREVNKTKHRKVNGVFWRTKIIILISVVCMFIIGFVVYQFNKSLLSKNEAMAKAEEYLNTVNTKIVKENRDYKIKNVEESTWHITKDGFWNTVFGKREWDGFIDGIGIKIDADSGDFIQMIFPLDGVITKKEFPQWFR